MANLNIPFLLPQGSQFSNFNLDYERSSMKYSAKGAEIILGSGGAGE